eukprot:TRINITY_DN5793_c0_g1_i1.p1 TRINITY_DN5793_c0_g1~~TRINITY_DN5793_c0_g1_i1.p1  ORF type:complete len:468 (-),score=24.79 TRINITY_DN5793_c0_g1_i1:2916-4319(-)
MRPTRKARYFQNNQLRFLFLLLVLPLLTTLLSPLGHSGIVTEEHGSSKSTSFTTAHIPAQHNRLLYPWLVLPFVRPPSLIESGFRLLHSSVSEDCTAGLGHAFTVVNAELSTALLLQASYSHRSTHLSTIPVDPDTLFNWGEGFLSRSEVGDRFCHLHRDSIECPVCEEISDEGHNLFHRIAVVPLEISYGCVSCRSNLNRVIKYLDEHGQNHTLLQMHPGRCKELPKSPDFTLSRPFFYSQYWRASPKSSLSETNLNIVIHARRGDFFSHSNRRMTSLRVFAKVLRNALAIVNNVGDIFSQIPVKVVLFSEGRQLRHSAPHDVSSMDNQFLDTDMQPKHAGHLYELLAEEVVQPEHVRFPRRSVSFPHGISVEFRIATDIEDAVRCMVAADIFVGSASDLSEYSIRVVSRAGLQFLPDYLGFVSGCCAIKFGKHGQIDKAYAQLMEEYWTLFVRSNRASALRAVGL